MGNGGVFSITPSGTKSTLYSFAGGSSDGSVPGSALIQAGDGNLYGTTINGGASNNGTVFKVSLSGTEAVVYSFAGGSDGADPFGLIQGSDGNLYGTTSAGGAQGAGTVFRITPSGTKTVLYSFAGGNSDGASPASALVLATDGNFYGTTYGGGAGNAGTVFKVTPNGA